MYPSYLWHHDEKSSSNHENQPRHQIIKELKVHIMNPSKETKLPWSSTKKIYTTITKLEIQNNKHQGCTYLSNHVMPKSMTSWSQPWTEQLTLNVSNLLTLNSQPQLSTMTKPSNNISSLLHEDKSANHVTKGIDDPNPSHKYEYASIMKDQ